MADDIFAFNDYKVYINSRLDDKGSGGGHGSRSRLATAIGCQTSYVAQVLKGSAHFSLEQLEMTNEFLNHDELEGQFLLLLAQQERAGNSKLRARFKKQIEEIRESRLSLKNRIDAKLTLSVPNQLVYYSAWYFSAIHVMSSQSGFSNPKMIANRLGLDVQKVSNAIQFLIEAGLIEKRGSDLHVGKSRIHLGADSPLISKHHINWRLQAIQSLEKTQRLDLHYTSVVTLSSEDVERIREILIKTIQSAKRIIKDSPEEKTQCFSLDFFEL